MKQEKEHTTLHIDAYIIPHSNVDMEARKNTRRAEEEGEEDLGDGWEHKIKNKKNTNINTTQLNFHLTSQDNILTPTQYTATQNRVMSHFQDIEKMKRNNQKNSKEKGNKRSKRG